MTQNFNVKYDLEEKIGDFLKEEFLANRLKIERAQEIAEAVRSLEGKDRKNLNLRIAQLGEQFPEIRKIVVDFLVSL